MRKLVVFLVVLVVLALAADRGANYVAERTVSDRVQVRTGLQRTPATHIAGFPFLTQLYRGRFDQITVTAQDVPVGSGRRALDVRRLVVTFDDVRTDRRLRTFDAARGRATALIPYDELGHALGLRLSYAGQGAVRATKTVTVGGQTLRPSFTLVPKVLDGALGFGGRFAQSLPPAVVTELQQVVGVEVPLGRLPFGIKATGLEARQDGVVLRLSGANLSFSR